MTLEAKFHWHYWHSNLINFITFYPVQKFFITIVLCFTLVQCDDGKTIITPSTKRHSLELSGPALGTTYRIVIHSKKKNNIDRKSILKIIEDEIKNINEAFSNWESESQVSRLNRLKAKTPMPVSKDFQNVFLKSKKIYNLSKKKFDPAASQLFDLWGFGINQSAQYNHEKNLEFLPNKVELKQVLATSGMNQYTLSGNKILKKNSSVKINFNSIAKGFLVDKIFNRLFQKHKYLMVEIGGEIRVGNYLPENQEKSAYNQQKNWRIGIEQPIYNLQRRIFKVVLLTNKALATSGDYRNYFTVRGASQKKRYSHIIDPVIGYPISTNIKSATVIGPECIISDALATTLLLMTRKDGFEFMKSFPKYEAMLILSKNQDFPNEFHVEMTKGMKKYIEAD